MGASGAKRKVVECNSISLFFAVLAVLLALAVTFVLTYFLTRNAYEKKEEKGGGEEEKKEDEGPSAAELRLPKSIKPVNYDLTLKAYLPSYVDFPREKDFTFEAEVTMKLDILEPVQTIVLNMRNISINQNKCRLEVDGTNVDIVSITAHDRLEKVEIRPAEDLEKGKKAKLTLVYTGLITTKLGGLYQTKYADADGTPKVAIVTQMEPTEARLMVPCFDEPEFKASWKVRVIHPKGTIAISNGIEEKVAEDGDWKTTDFVETPKMSSYLLALMVSEFEQISNYTDSGVQFRIWSRREAKNTTQYALYAGIKCLEYYEKLFKIGFPLKKQDMIALPDFSAGAMENWGMITYRENSLLYDDKLYGPANKRRVAYVVAHELAHQWFGDLVTMKWWEDVWLNEGFATYVEFFGADWISDNKMRMKEWIILDALTSGLLRDSVSSSHPLSFKIDKATEVYEAFDSISYGKGASVLRMLAAVIGQDNFDDGVAHYLDKFKYSNAEALDLWQALDEKIVGKQIQGPNGVLKIVDFCDQWTTQMGFPLITVEQVNDTHVKLTQERYRRNPNAKDPKKYKDPKYGFKWDVPIWYQKGEGAIELAWLKRDEPLYLKLDNADQPIVINAMRNGFYRQNYDAKGWSKIANQLQKNHTVYSSQTRNAIVSDAFAAALIDKVPYETVFNLIRYVKKERDYLPWEETLNAFNSVLEFFGNEPESKFARNFMLKLLEPMYKTTSLQHIEKEYLNDDLFFEILVEQQVIDAYCNLGDRGCIANYKALFDEKVVKPCQGKNVKPSDCSTVAAPLRAKTYCYGVKEGGDEAFEKVMDLYMAESVQLEKDILRRALGCHKDITALKQLMLLALDRNSSFVRLQDVNDIFSSVAANPVGQEIIFNFLLERWDEIYNGLMPEHRAIGRTIESTTSGIRSQQQIEQIKHLKKNGKHAKEFGNFDEVIEKAESKVEWIKKNFRRLSDFFATSNVQV